MTSDLTPKYHRAPNFSINPPEAGGLLELGSIIASIASADEAPINESCHVPIPQDRLFCSHQAGFIDTRARLRSGEYGIVARLVGLEGIGGTASGTFERWAEEMYTVERIDTIYFTPSTEYIRDSMGKEDVKDYVEGTGYSEPVYMPGKRSVDSGRRDRSLASLVVTGLKTARGAGIKMAESRKRGWTAEVGVSLAPTGVPLEVGPKFNTESEMRTEMGFGDSTDFIVGIRVRKLAFKKHWLLRTPGALTSREHIKGATMVSDDPPGEGQVDDILDLGEGEDCAVESEIEIIDGEKIETAWIL
ncbi:hypothetical protein GQX73_g10400 [Xylaria multiplex]|uniref:Uncharacterized protein n=1 Tax=Xylaria multiplex TaxID=323545 RepID=A0A7C8IKA2_9PEZI|nr:hypothetical protein GQX73_g10400 [Xylaria multiplex]